jgi:O-antigen ligase
MKPANISVERVADDSLRGTGPAYATLIIVLAIMLGGIFPAIFILFSQTAVWLVWSFLWIAIIILWIKLPVIRLMRPMTPMIVWLLGYIIWGIMSATYPILDSGFRLAFRFITIALTIAIITSHPKNLSLFAEASQWVLVLNLIVTFILMTFPQYQSLPMFTRLNVESYTDRFAGLWGDANEAGLVSLIILVLSYWARPWIAWMGRICGVLIIYLTVSRTATWILVGLLVFHFMVSLNRKTQLKILIFFVVLLSGFFCFAKYKNLDPVAIVANNPTVSRVMDITEAKTRAEGIDSRVDLMARWMSLASKEPWYGYGLYSLEGDESHETWTHRGFPSAGTHNLYLGLYIDAGLVGLSTFLLLIGYQLINIYRAPLPAKVLRAIFSLCFVALVFANANHQLIMAYPGWIAFSLIFLLPYSPALRPSNQS